MRHLGKYGSEKYCALLYGRYKYKIVVVFRSASFSKTCLRENNDDSVKEAPAYCQSFLDGLQT